MDGETEEHIAEVARVLSRYVDLIGVRAFPKFQDWSVDREDRVIHAFAKYATVPVINMETITHPCQELAHILALAAALRLRRPARQEIRADLDLPSQAAQHRGGEFGAADRHALRHGRDPAVPDAGLRARRRYCDFAQGNVAENGGSFQISHDIEASYRGADVVYAKSWGALPYFGRWEQEKPIREEYKHFIVDEAKMALTNNGVFSHCLPLRRNVKATDAVMDSPACIAIDEAENRLHVQKAIMAALIKQS